MPVAQNHFEMAAGVRAVRVFRDNLDGVTAPALPRPSPLRRTCGRASARLDGPGAVPVAGLMRPRSW
jgi:hypothetical protein